MPGTGAACRNRNYPVSDLITEEHITEYIMLRYIVTSDYDELITRWAKGNTLYWYSARDVYDDFAKNDVQNNIMQFREKNPCSATLKSSG